MAAKKTNSKSKNNNNTIKKSDIKKIKKAAKKAPKGLVIFIVIIIIAGLVGAGIWLYKSGKFDEWFNNKGKTTQTTTITSNKPAEEKEDGIIENIIYDDFQIHFLELGNDAAGDSIYIKAGDNDILIDAGSRPASAKTIKTYVDNYCKDNKLEFVIGTHGDQDHISGMFGTKDGGKYNGILYSYDIGTIIKQAYTTKTTATYNNYLAGIEYAKENGAKCYTAAECFNNKNGAKRTYTLAENITMDIVYNYYYFNNTTDDENNYSVCTMFNYNDKHFLLTGDLELEGETEMAKYYDGSTKDKTLPKVELFKAGHHGSKTSSNECLLRLIEPKICVACCCAGTSEYTNNLEHQFPTQAFINRIAAYTSRVYVTSMIKFIDNEWKFTSMNGNIVVSSNGDKIALNASNNLTRLKDTEWFNEKIYAVKTNATYTWNEAKDKFPVYQNCPKAGSYDFYTKDTEGAVLIPRRTWPQNGK